MRGEKAAGGGLRQEQTWALSWGCPVSADRGQRTEGRLDCRELTQGALCWWKGKRTPRKPTWALGTLESGFSVGHSFQKGSQGTENLLVGPYHLQQGFHLCICGLWFPVATHPPHLGQMALSLGMATGTGRGQTDHVWSDQLPPPWLGLGPSTITPCVQAEPEHSNNGQGHLCCGLPHPWPSSRARLTLQGERNQGVAFRMGRWAPALHTSACPAPCLLYPHCFGGKESPSSHHDV